MGVSWTDEQKKVIDTRDKNILVSAAAGSGKTAVLVERIIKLITDEDNPIDIDSLLVVTFTKAAASEMRERITKAIDKRLTDDPENENLLRQSSLIHNALITTIDSFCLFVVRNHFEEINLDPNFRVADEGEIKLIEKDVIDALFEEKYKAKDESFLKLVDAYSNKRNDSNVKDMVEKVYRLSKASPWPKEWVSDLIRYYDVSDEKELLETPVYKELISQAKVLMLEMKVEYERLIAICEESDGPLAYGTTLANDMTFLEGIEDLNTYEQLKAAVDRFSPQKLATIKKADAEKINAEKREFVKKSRDKLKEKVASLSKNYFSLNLSESVEQIKSMKEYVSEICNLAIDLIDSTMAVKRKKCIMDFSDIEHFALDILVDSKTKQVTESTKEFKNHFNEIMIDEYQDSNLVQEVIMTAISREDEGVHNMFMVGDVKQSIYRFRLAKPELFVNKYNSFSKEGEKDLRIDLFKNFRSRREVLDYANDIFYKIMATDLGAVAYDDAAALYNGATDYPESDDVKPECMLLDLKDVDKSENKRTLEARMVAGKILDLMANNKVYDRDLKEMRDMRYSDIVILFRSLNGWGNEFAEVLKEYGIPAHVTSKTGYFEAREVVCILNMLRILDNPYQDIPMAAVLRSKMVGLTDEELAEIKAKHKDISFAEAALYEMEEASEGSLYDFYQIFKELRARKDSPIHEIIRDILNMTGYKNYICSLPSGKRRYANVFMLQEKAVAFEKSSYKGIFHFMRYIDLLRKYEVDEGEADVTGENADLVHIMTIHKSKGLEYPVVFVSGMSKEFNQMDTKDMLVVHEKLGIGLNEMKTDPRRKIKTVYHSQISEYIKKENLGEEVRVLYVALTRAKEKLILTATVSDAAKATEGRTGNVKEMMPVSFTERFTAKSYTDWIISAMISYPDKYTINYVSVNELIEKEARKAAEERLDYEELMAKITSAKDHLNEAFEREFSFEYPYASDITKKSKYSVSEIKHASMSRNYEELENESEKLIKPEFEEKTSYIPSFARKEEETEDKLPYGVNQGALRGTAIHRVMECLDFEKIAELDRADGQMVATFVRKELDRMHGSGQLADDLYGLIIPRMIEDFVKSDIAYRMSKAALAGELYKEKAFVSLYEGALLQGIIDVFWRENEEILVLDYKTDNVDTGEELVLRYKEQLKLYGEALANVFSNEKKAKVKASLIYSFKLKEVIEIE